VRAALADADKHFAALRDNVTVTVLHYNGYGTDWIKRNKLGPDGFVQMALQLAYYRLHNTFVATYETGQTRQFHNGRTDTVRPCSIESAEFCKLMLSPDATHDQKLAAFNAALKAVGTYMKDVVDGRGFDRHLMGLRLIAAEQGLDTPAVFNDPLYKRATTFKLSTSNVPTRGIVNGGFGPVAVDGYGVCYQLFPTFLTFNMYVARIAARTRCLTLSHHAMLGVVVRVVVVTQNRQH
jgi:carnitine O-acetyltransferase